MIRLYVNQPLAVSMHCELQADAARYLRQVMRQQAGDSLLLFNGQGGEYEAEILALHRYGGECIIHRYDDVSRELPCAIHIIQTASRSEKIEQVLQKATELGASTFCITTSERSQLRLPESKLSSRLARWQKIIIEAAEQSGRTVVPTVTWLPRLRQLDHDSTCSCYLHPMAKAGISVLSDQLTQGGNIRLAIGPEGGWSAQDCELLEQRGFQGLRFGARIMRTETAAPALLAAMQALHDTQQHQ